MRVNMAYLDYSPQRLWNLIQSFQSCWVFTVDMCTWSATYVPPMLLVIPYSDADFPQAQPPMEEIDFTAEIR